MHSAQEYQYVQDELRRQQAAVHAKLQEKDAEMGRLVSQVAASKPGGVRDV